MNSTIFTNQYLPNKPLASNNIKQGVKRFKKEQALEKTFIETQPKGIKNLMVFDVDVEDSDRMIKSLAWDDKVIPEPNIITTNLDTTHSHIVYFLDGIISTQKAENYYNSIRNRLQEKLLGDTAYGSRIMRNPLTHATDFISNREYKLSELESFVPDYLPYIEKSNVEIAAGRNDALFINLRQYGYATYRQSNYDNDTLFNKLETQAYFLNYSSFDKPLEQNEVNRIVKSIYRWIIRNHSKEVFSTIQQKRAIKRWGNTKEIKDIQILELKDNMELNYNQIGLKMGITASAAKTAYYRAKKRN